METIRNLKNIKALEKIFNKLDIKNVKRRSKTLIIAITDGKVYGYSSLKMLKRDKHIHSEYTQVLYFYDGYLIDEGNIEVFINF